MSIVLPFTFLIHFSGFVVQFCVYDLKFQLFFEVLKVRLEYVLEALTLDIFNR